MSGERTRLPQPFCDDARDAADRGSLCFRVAGFPASRNRITEIESIDSIGEVAHEIAAAQFAIGEDFEAEFLLARKHAADVRVFQFAETFRGAGTLHLPRGQQIGGRKRLPT